MDSGQWGAACVSHCWVEKCCLFSRERHLLANEEVKACEIVVMLQFIIYLTSHVHSWPGVVTFDESFLKWFDWNDNSRAGLLKSDCQDCGGKGGKTWKKWPSCWSQKLAASFLLQTEMFLRLLLKQTNVFLSGTGKLYQAVLISAWNLHWQRKQDSPQFTGYINIVIITQKRD